MKIRASFVSNSSSSSFICWVPNNNNLSLEERMKELNKSCDDESEDYRKYVDFVKEGKRIVYVEIDNNTEDVDGLLETIFDLAGGGEVLYTDGY